MNGSRHIIGSFNHGSMANAPPQAIGVQATDPDRQVVALCGDGGLAVPMGELLTLRQLHLPVKAVIFNIAALAFVELEMKEAGIVNYGTDLDNPDFAQVAQAVGLFGARLERCGELEKALSDAFAHPGAAVVDVRTTRQELAIPPREPKGGKGLCPLRCPHPRVRRGDELIELARSNLRQLDRE